MMELSLYQKIVEESTKNPKNKVIRYGENGVS